MNISEIFKRDNPPSTIRLSDAGKAYLMEEWFLKPIEAAVMAKKKEVADDDDRLT